MTALGKAEPVAISILGKEYRVTCGEDEREDLLRVSRYLDEQMRTTKVQGKIVGMERIAVMTALNLAKELMTCQGEKADYAEKMNAALRRMHSKLESVHKEQLESRRR